MSVYVLVGGGWLGGWCWQEVARRLREEGQDVYPVTLTGLGERVHLASPEVDLAHATSPFCSSTVPSHSLIAPTGTARRPVKPM